MYVDVEYSVNVDNPGIFFFFSNFNEYCIIGKNRFNSLRPFNKAIIVSFEIFFYSNVIGFINGIDPVKIHVVDGITLIGLVLINQ